MTKKQYNEGKSILVEMCTNERILFFIVFKNNINLI